MTFFWKISFLGWLAMIVVMSLMSNPPLPTEGILAWDKFQHAAAYACLTFFGGMAFTFFNLASAGRWLMAMTISVVTGGILELAQGSLTTVRSAEWVDMLADVAGTLVVAAGGIAIGVLKNYGR